MRAAPAFGPAGLADACIAAMSAKAAWLLSVDFASHDITSFVC